MIPIISFIGWQNSGKTTIVREVVAHLREKGLRVAVIKSSHHQGITFGRPGSDTSLYQETGAQDVALLAPDQLVILRNNPQAKLVDIVNRTFPDCDIVIGEGFKNERHIAKIEVVRGSAELLRDRVGGVIGMITDQDTAGENVFRPGQAKEVAEFIFSKFLKEERGNQTILYVNGRKIPLKGFVQEALAGTVSGFIQSLKQTEEMQDIELRIRLKHE